MQNGSGFFVRALALQIVRFLCTKPKRGLAGQRQARRFLTAQPQPALPYTGKAVVKARVLPANFAQRFVAPFADDAAQPVFLQHRTAPLLHTKYGSVIGVRKRTAHRFCKITFSLLIALSGLLIYDNFPPDTA